MSFQIAITPSRRAAARFIASVRRAVQVALADAEKEHDIKQADIARSIGVHRSVINREIRGHKDITLGRLAELAWAMGYEPVFNLEKPRAGHGANAAAPAAAAASAFNEVAKGTGATPALHSPRASHHFVVTVDHTHG